MEGLLFGIVQLAIQALLGLIKLVITLAVLLGRLLALVLPGLFRLLAKLIPMLAAACISWLRAKHEWRGQTQRAGRSNRPPSTNMPRLGGSTASSSGRHRRRYKVDNFWRKGGK